VFYNQDDQQQGDTYWPLSSIGIDGKNKKDLIPKLLDPQGLDYDNKKVYYVEHHGQRLGVVNEERIEGNAVRKDDVPDIVAPDGQMIHGHWRLALHCKLDVLHMYVHRHVDSSDCALHNGAVLQLHHHTFVAELHEKPDEPHGANTRPAGAGE